MPTIDSVKSCAPDDTLLGEIDEITTDDDPVGPPPLLLLLLLLPGIAELQLIVSNSARKMKQERTAFITDSSSRTDTLRTTGPKFRVRAYHERLVMSMPE